MAGGIRFRALRWATVGAVVVAGCLAGGASARATEPAATFDVPGQRHNNVCVHLASPSEPLRFSDGTPDGFTLSDDLRFSDGECQDGAVRLDLHEVIPSSSGLLAFHRGGQGYVSAKNVKYGALDSGDIADVLPPPVPSSGGRGAACTLSDEAPYEVSVQSIPADMHYKRPQDVPNGSNNGTSFEHYGDPGADQGDRHDIHYSYLLWSFLDVRGGGHVRVLLRPEQVIRSCDVAPVTMSSWDSAGNVNGEVTARYVRVLAGSCPLYGWMVWTHTYSGDPSTVVEHALPVEPPPPDPTPNPACPVAEPGSPPQVVTGDAQPAADGTATLSGTVNSKGVPTTYHVEFGLDTTYGSTTPEGSLSSVDQPVTVSTQLNGVPAGTTYHYRLVASNTHGTSFGDDRTFTVPLPPPPPPPPLPPPLPPPPSPAAAPAPPAPSPVTSPQPPAASAPVVLSRLYVSPPSFRRARRRDGVSARIDYTLSSRAAVTITFLQAVTGVRAGRDCRPLPRGGLPRGARRCTRWLTLKGSLHQPARSRSVSVGFGGWLGRTPLAPGRYRVRVAALTSTGKAGPARLAGFRVRSR